MSSSNSRPMCPHRRVGEHRRCQEGSSEPGRVVEYIAQE
jgi:hypothetical protein